MKTCFLKRVFIFKRFVAKQPTDAAVKTKTDFLSCSCTYFYQNTEVVKSKRYKLTSNSHYILAASH